MKKAHLIGLGTAALFVVISVTFLLTKATIKPEQIAISPLTGEVLGGYSQGANNILTFVSSNATTTAVGLPTLLIARNPTRQYCYVVNNSDTAIFLTFKNFASDVAASTSVGVANGGLRLNANGGSYECLPENMVQSDIWASSTASGKQILSGQQ